MISRTLATLSCIIIAFPSPALAQKKIQQLQNINGLRFNVLQANQKNSEIINLPKSDPSGTDILRFLNGDIMHGKFAGIKAGILWSRPDMKQDTSFQLKNLRQIVFKSHQKHATQPISPFVSLANGDIIPGKIISLDDTSLTLESTIAGRLTIPRQQIKSLTPNPFGGQLLYAGPFTSDNWIIIEQKETKEIEPDIEEEPQAQQEAEKEIEKEKPLPWLYSGTSLYSTNSTPIAIDAKLSDIGRLRFKLSWRNRLSANLAFHADFTRPLPRKIIKENPAEEKKEDEEDEEKKEKAPPKYHPLTYESLFDLKKGNALQSIDWLTSNSNSNFHQTYGSSYILSLNSNYATLHHCTFDKNGNPLTKSRRGTRINDTSFYESGQADFDLRFDRTKKTIILYVNGKYSSQWNEIHDYAGKGSAIGFAATGNCRLKISDILSSTWSGTPDTAASLQHHERDIALLTNGTDRFSGKITTITNGKVTIKNPYADISIPLTELSEVHLHTTGAPPKKDIKWPKNTGILLFKPIGRLTLVPTTADPQSITGTSPILGELKVDLKAASLLQFAEHPEALNDWITDF